MDKKVGVGIVGSQFITTIHAESLQRVPEAAILAVMSPTPGNAKKFAHKFGIPNHFTNLEEMLAMDAIDIIVIGAPNFLHCDITLKAAKAGNTVGWSFTMYEETWNYGFPQEFAHFVDCVKMIKLHW